MPGFFLMPRPIACISLPSPARRGARGLPPPPRCHAASDARRGARARCRRTSSGTRGRRKSRELPAFFLAWRNRSVSCHENAQAAEPFHIHSAFRRASACASFAAARFFSAAWHCAEALKKPRSALALHANLSACRASSRDRARPHPSIPEAWKTCLPRVVRARANLRDEIQFVSP